VRGGATRSHTQARVIFARREAWRSRWRWRFVGGGVVWVERVGIAHQAKQTNFTIQKSVYSTTKKVFYLFKINDSQPIRAHAALFKRGVCPPPTYSPHLAA
jgi:hypothetical protein